MKTNKHSVQLIILITALFLFNASCKKKNNIPEVPEPPGNEEELITTFKVELTDSATGTKKTYQFRDPDGDGGQAPYYGPDKNSQSDSVMVLQAGHSYSVQIIMLDESKNPVVTVSEEVKNEGVDHMLFYNQGANNTVNANPLTVSLANGMLIRYLDLDEGNPKRPLGLHTWWRTGNTAAKMPLNITLRHQPGVKDGTYAPGESDVSVNFKVEVQQ